MRRSSLRLTPCARCVSPRRRLAVCSLLTSFIHSDDTPASQRRLQDPRRPSHRRRILSNFFLPLHTSAGPSPDTDAHPRPHFSDTGERCSTPVHGLLWACQSPKLARLSRRQDPRASVPSPADSLFLPRVSLSIPCRSGWPILHRYICAGSTARLLDSLLAQPHSLATSMRLTEDQRRANMHFMRLLRIREVWLDAVALELSDRQLWETLRRAWDVVVNGLRDGAAASGERGPERRVGDLSVGQEEQAGMESGSGEAERGAGA